MQDVRMRGGCGMQPEERGEEGGGGVANKVMPRTSFSYRGPKRCLHDAGGREGGGADVPRWGMACEVMETLGKDLSDDDNVFRCVFLCVVFVRVCRKSVFVCACRYIRVVVCGCVWLRVNIYVCVLVFRVCVCACV